MEPLHSAVKNRDLAQLHNVLNSGAVHVNKLDQEGYSPLLIACQIGFYEGAAALVAAGAEINRWQHDGGTPLIAAAWRKDAPMVRMLLESGRADVNYAHRDGLTALQTAAFVNAVDVVELLLDFGASVDAARSDGVTAIIFAASEGYQQVVQLLLGHGAQQNLQDKEGGTALMAAAWKGFEPICRQLVEMGADVNLRHKDGITPLIFAGGMGHEEIVKLLLLRGAQVNAVQKQKWTTLHFAATKEHTEVLELLLRNSADKDAKTEYGLRPLDLAVREGHLSIVKQLVGHGVMIRNDTINLASQKARFSNNPDRHKIKDYLTLVSKGWSPLHVAAMHQDVEGGKTFLSYNYSLEATTVREVKHTTSWNPMSGTRWPAGLSARQLAMELNHTKFLSELDAFKVELQYALDAQHGYKPYVPNMSTVQWHKKVEEIRQATSSHNNSVLIKPAAGVQFHSGRTGGSGLTASTQPLSTLGALRGMGPMTGIPEIGVDMPSGVMHDIRRARELVKYPFTDLELATENWSDTSMIGRGGFGNVYRGWIQGQQVAIKKLKIDTVRQEDFDNEVHIVAQIIHPRVVQLLGVCVPHRCLVYELMEGGSLEDQLSDFNKALRLSFFDRISIMLDSAQGLAHLHSRGIFHRDIKPANILLDRTRGAKLGDVGLAKMMPEHQQVESGTYKPKTSSSIAGTGPYMDPVYFATGKYRPESDIYSFGITMLRTLTGHHPQYEGFRDKADAALDDEQSNEGVIEALDPNIHKPPPVDLALRALKLALACADANRYDKRPALMRGVPTKSRLPPIIDELQDIVRLLDEADVATVRGGAA